MDSCACVFSSKPIGSCYCKAFVQVQECLPLFFISLQHIGSCYDNIALLKPSLMYKEAQSGWSSALLGIDNSCVKMVITKDFIISIFEEGQKLLDFFKDRMDRNGDI